MLYRSTPHATTGKVCGEQARQKQHHDARAGFQQFAVGTSHGTRRSRQVSVEAWYHTRALVFCILSGQMDGGQMQWKHVDHI